MRDAPARDAIDRAQYADPIPKASNVVFARSGRGAQSALG
jgi:hypothetical protein